MQGTQETQVRSLGQEDPWGREGSPSSTLAWKVPWTEESGGLQSTGPKESDTTEQLSTQQHSGKGKMSRLKPLKAQEQPCLSLIESPHCADSENRSR